MTCSLPFLDRVYRVDQHEDVEQEAVPDPDDQHRLRQHEYRECAAEPEVTSEREPEPAGKDVAERLYDRVSMVAVRHSPFTVASDDELRVLGYLSEDFDRDRHREPPECRQPWQDERQQPAEQEAVQHVRKGKRAKELLRVVRAPSVARPQTQMIARTPPQASLAMKLVRRCQQNCDDGEPRQRSFHPGLQHTCYLNLYRREDFTKIVTRWLPDHQRMGVEDSGSPRLSPLDKNSGAHARKRGADRYLLISY